MFDQLPMYQQKGKSAFNAKLANINRLVKRLQHPEKKFRSIHVAGTNGKGSSCHMLASVLQEAGYTVGLYTSPHLKDFRERIRVNGQLVDEQYVVEYIAANKAFFEKENYSFFEMTVGMAFLYFAQVKVDIAIIEVGLGGRLDATNVIIPEVALITNIGYDHTAILGNSLQEIAKEKAGIIKDGIPVVISETQEEIKDVFKAIASRKNAPLFFADESGKASYQTDLLGAYQAKNMNGVFAVLKMLKNFSIPNTAFIDGFKKVAQNTGLLGRWQNLGENPKVICDTAHNEEGLDVVLNQLLEENFDTLHIVLGFVKEKNLNTILPLFPKFAHYYFCSPKISRGLDAITLKEKASALNIEGKSFNSVKQAFTAAKKKASSRDLIFIGGSNFVVAEVL